jgi:hypothetical protein
MRSIVSLALGCGFVSNLFAQAPTAAVLKGVVLTGTSRWAVVEAEVAIPSLQVSARTDSVGRFEISGIMPGEHQLVVRKLGYAPVSQVITFASGDALQRTLYMDAAVTMDTVIVSAIPVLPDFEANRSIGLGKFLTRADLAKLEGRRFSEALIQLPGIQFIRGSGNAMYLTSSRGRKSLNQPGACFSHVYLDKMLIYGNRERFREEPFNLNSIRIEELEAIEYYTGAAQTPLRYSKLNSNCGVLVLHTRRTP